MNSDVGDGINHLVKKRLHMYCFEKQEEDGGLDRVAGRVIFSEEVDALRKAKFMAAFFGAESELLKDSE